jgi:glycosyltransferase involved in cell wall biosynthesis
MRVLFIHQNFPGQYLHLAPAMAKQGHHVVGLGDQGLIPKTRETPGVKRVGYASPQVVKNEKQHRYLVNFEGQVRRGQQLARALLQMKKNGFKPDLIHVHPGWGEALYIKDVYPDVPLVCLFEYYYSGNGQDTDFDPEFPADLNEKCKVNTWNANLLLSLEAADAGLCPTLYQKSVQPEAYQNKIEVIHEGINVDIAKPNPDARLVIRDDGGQVELRGGDEVVTFINRNLEPYRGWHTFARAMPHILKRPNVRIVIVGGTRKGYGKEPPKGTWKEMFLKEVEGRIDRSRIHFVNRVPYPQLIKLLQLSKAHVYLTYPFVLSWSMLDAMSCGARVIGSKTAPVEEVIKDGENGLLVDFFKPREVADAVTRVLDDQALSDRISAAARQTVIDNYELGDCLEKQIDFISQVREKATRG